MAFLQAETAFSAFRSGNSWLRPRAEGYLDKCALSADAWHWRKMCARFDEPVSGKETGRRFVSIE